MIYEHALMLIGEQPTWLLADILERLPRGSLEHDAAACLLRHRCRVKGGKKSIRGARLLFGSAVNCYE